MDKAFNFLMRRLSAIGKLNDEDRHRVDSLPFNQRRFSKGEEVVAEGSKSTSCCLVVTGYLHRSKELATGSRQIFSLHMPGDIPDLHSLHLPRMDHSLVATAPAEVALIPHTAIQGVLGQSSTLTALFWRDTLIDAAAFRAWMLMLGQAEALVRMAHLFCELYVRSKLVGLNRDNSFALPISQTDLADMLGTSTVHANRTLQDLRSQELVDFKRGRVTILRWEELARLGMFDSSYLHIVGGAQTE
jgi:CRP-like cAMP-binding protein